MDAAQRVAVILSETKYLVHSDFETLHHVQDDTLPDESVSGHPIALPEKATVNEGSNGKKKIRTTFPHRSVHCRQNCRHRRYMPRHTRSGGGPRNGCPHPFPAPEAAPPEGGGD